MADGSDSIQWDVVDLNASWNLFGLPVLLLIVAVIVWIHHRSRPQTTAGFDSPWAVVRYIGLIHCGLAIQSMIALAQEVLAIRALGNPQSHATFVGAIIGSVVNPLLGLGILCRRPLYRWLAIAWYAILSLLAILVVAWLSYYHVAFDAASWPEQLISKVRPFILLVVMLLPRTKYVFARRARGAPSSAGSNGVEGALAQPQAPAGRPVVSLVTLLLLIVVCSNLVMDAVDWGYRLITEAEPVP
jgi:hypothetical protein